MDLIQSVYNISDEFLNMVAPTREHVRIDIGELAKLAEKMKKDGKVNFYSEEPQEANFYSEPQEASEKNKFFVVLRELVASSINYCYWYGNANVRPNGADSTKMYELVDTALVDMRNKQPFGVYQLRGMQYYEKMFKNSINYLIELLGIMRFPLLEERKRHLLELTEDNKAVTFAKYVTMKNSESGEELLEELVKTFTGFASDIFLKRTALFFIQLNRQLGWYNDLVNKLFVPADYQVPKMLEYFNVLKYSNDLEFKIQEGKLIEKGSLMECQIRSGTVIACMELCEATRWNVAEVDTYLWTKRKLPKKKFHLTITTDY